MRHRRERNREVEVERGHRSPRMGPSHLTVVLMGALPPLLELEAKEHRKQEENRSVGREEGHDGVEADWWVWV
jgi:hypothetical protein